MRPPVPASSRFDNRTPGRRVSSRPAWGFRQGPSAEESFAGSERPDSSPGGAKPATFRRSWAHRISLSCMRAAKCTTLRLSRQATMEDSVLQGVVFFLPSITAQFTPHRETLPIRPASGSCRQQRDEAPARQRRSNEIAKKTHPFVFATALPSSILRSGGISPGRRAILRPLRPFNETVHVGVGLGTGNFATSRDIARPSPASQNIRRIPSTVPYPSIHIVDCDHPARIPA